MPIADTAAPLSSSVKACTPLWDRVWSKVDQSAGFDACWLWRGAHSLKRRGHKRPVIQTAGRGSKVALVARIMCEWRNGPPPSRAHEAGHICPDGENHRCVNPRHLVWMTRSENELHKRIENALTEVA